MDIIDRACHRESRHREIALELQQKKGLRTETPTQISGKRVCTDCYSEVPKPRLDANPNAVRCIDCQTIKEFTETN